MHATATPNELTQIDMSNRMPTYAIPNNTPSRVTVQQKQPTKKAKKQPKKKPQNKTFASIHFT